MNRSFRAPEKEMAGTTAVRQRQHQMIGNLRNSSMREKEEELGLFLEMRKREKERHDLLLQNAEEEFDSSLGSRTGSSPIFSMPSAPTVRKTGADEFLNSENDKNDYDWLLTPPGTPLFPSLEMDSQKTVMNQNGTTKAHPNALKSRLSNNQSEATGRNMVSRQRASSPGPSVGLRRPSSSGGPGSRPSTPTGRPASSTSSRPISNPVSKSTTMSKSTSTTTSRPSRSSTPTSRPILSSSKPTVPARSSTPTRSTARSSTPTSRPSLSTSKPASRASTPTRRPATLSTVTKTSAPPVKSPTFSTSASNTTRNAAQPSAGSPSARPRPWKPQEMPGYTLDAPPNLRTSLTDRPILSMRGRAGAPSSRSSSIEPVPNGRVRRQSCSPSRGRLPNGVSRKSGTSVPVPSLNRAYAKANDNVSPGSYGTKMVERVINMRKLVPPMQDDKQSPRSNLSGKSSSPDSSGFGRSLSKKSLDMAMRHMDIRRTVPSNLRPLMTKIPASSMYSVRPGPTRNRMISVSDSPLATSSNASSEMSVNNNQDENIEEESNSERGVRSPASIRGR
ncbi:mucin-17-like [Cynara cardunculus var. scolymus]|uniref:mucin-17-like n=1 Tax=Cynara cardunculus var. scolymus TaxID=59895 RepID=UPI000D62A321|nr:mucin-17-like [Cynara cardunculus var. scolymus]